MIDNNCNNLSIAKQCDLLSVNKSTYYYKQRGLTEQDLEIMKMIDEIYKTGSKIKTFVKWAHA